MKDKIKDFLNLPGTYLLLAFLIINIICGHHGGNNVNSRYSLLRTMSHNLSFEITPIVEYKGLFWTDDWSRTPDQRYFSNKAPGSAFFALPIFLPLDYLSKFTMKNKNRFFHKLPSRTTRKLTSIISQIGLFVFLLFWLRKNNLLADVFKRRKELSLFLIMFCFANTGSNYMNTLFGHGLALVLTFWFINSLLTKNYTHLGLSFGFALLNDYSFAFFLLPALLLLLKSDNKLKDIKSFALAGIPGGVLWVWYHTSSFGSPLAIANKFQNPKYVDVASKTKSLWGIFSLEMNWDIMGELFYGLKRGILITQPWVIVSVLLSIYCVLYKSTERSQKEFHFFGIIMFFCLFMMNASFGGWHGGSTIGPRYMAIVFPWMAVSMIFALSSIKNLYIHLISYLSIGVGIVFYTLVNATKIHSHHHNVWQDLLNFYSQHDLSSSIKRTILGVVILFVALKMDRTATLQAKSSAE